MDKEKPFYEEWRMKKKPPRIYQEFNSPQEIEIDSEKLAPFLEFSNHVFDFFEELSGKKTNRSLMHGHLDYYFEEGFTVESMKLYIRAQRSETFYKVNPEKFRITNLFPIKDQDRINLVWDYLAHYESCIVDRQTIKLSLEDAMQIHLHCGHQMNKKDLDEFHGSCAFCILEGNELEIIQDPYSALKILVSPQHDEWIELAQFFLKHPEDETFEMYANRTHEKRREIAANYHRKMGNPSQLLKKLA